jgi:predicted GNAT superfamily acetyltransferase
LDQSDLPHPGERLEFEVGKSISIILVEIPSDFQAVKSASLDLALEWRLHTRSIFEDLFREGYLATDFVRTDENPPHSYYVLVHGESTL